MTNILLAIVSFSWLFSQIFRIQFGNGLSINILDIVVGSSVFIILIWFIQHLLKRKSLFSERNTLQKKGAGFIYKKKLNLFFKDKISKVILIFSSIMILSLLWNRSSLSLEQFIFSGFYAVRWIVYALLFFFIRESSRENKEKIQRIMLVTGIIFVAIGYMQFFYYSNLKNLFYLGWDEHMYRLFGAFLDPNFTGIFLSLFLVFLLGKRLKMPIEPLTKNKLFLSIIIAFTLGSLILTFSRSAFLTLFFASTVFFFLIGKKRWIFIMIGIMLVVGMVLSQRFYIESVNPFRTISYQARLKSMKEAIGVFSHKPVLGVGFNAYRYAQLHYGSRGQQNIETSHADAGVENSFFFVLATTGILGLIAYVFMLFNILKNTYRNPVVFSSIVGLCIGSMFINALFFPPLMLWMWVVVGLSD